MQSGDRRIFKKSGNLVELVEPVPKAQPKAWVVKRVSGRSAGKELICLQRCLLTDAQFNE